MTKGTPQHDLPVIEPDGGNPLTVLVVDDSSTMRMIIKKELEEAGYNVATFSDGLEALSALHWMSKPPDLITLDIDMPRMDGFVCCQKIRAQEAAGLFGYSEARIPVLFVSANDTLENRRRGFHLGSLEFVSKPFARGDIVATVNRMLRPQLIFAGMTALVVDDTAGVRKMVATCLQRLGLEILEAENGREAFDIVRAHPHRIDMAIVDFDMPIMRGDEFIHLTRQIVGVEHLPLLSLSAFDQTDAILRMFRAGATDYLIKPFIAEELLARVQVHLHLRRHMQHLEAMNRDLYEDAVYDGLTGLRNKRYFQEAFGEMFSRALRAGTELSALFFDLDYFKKVNDTCGHGFGDYVLQTIGALVKKNVRRGDLAARFGGEEFVVALPNIDLQHAMIIAEKIRLIVQEHRFEEQGKQWPVTVSIGVASLHAHYPSTAADMLQLADQALYRAKNFGRNQVVSFSNYSV